MDVKNIARAGIGQGFLMGWGDEAEALGASMYKGTKYQDEVKKIRKEYGEYAGKHPVTSTAAEFAGGILPLAASYLAAAGSGGTAAPTAAATTARTVGVLSRLKSILSNPIARSATSAGAQGFVTGAGSATEGNRLSSGIVGGAVGTGLGATAPIAVRGAKGAAAWLGERLAPSEKLIEKHAAKKINRALKEAKLTPKDIPEKIKADRELGVPATVANIDPALVDLAETVAQRSGPSARTVESKLWKQTAGTRERVYSQARKGLHPGDFYEDEQRMVNDLRNQARTMYDEAYNFGTVNDPRINEVLKTPQFKSFYDTAKGIARNEELAAKLRGEDPSKYKLKQIMEIGKDGSIKLTDAPDVRTLDYIKRGIDATIDSGFRGQGMSTAEANSLKELRNVFTNALDEATTINGESAYRNARKAYAGDMEVLDALRSGMNDFNKMDHEEIIKLVSEMGDAEKQAFKTGVVRDIYSKIMNPSGNINAAQRLLGPETQAKLQPLFDSPAHFNLFKAAVEREAQLYQQANKVLGGAATGRRIQARERFENDNVVGEAVGDMISGSSPANSLMNIAARFARKASVSDDVADKVANMLMSSEPSEVAAAVKLLEDYGAKAQVASKALNTTEMGIAGGTTAASTINRPPGEEGQSIETQGATINNPSTLGPGIEDTLKQPSGNIPGNSIPAASPKPTGPGIEEELNR